MSNKKLFPILIGGLVLLLMLPLFMFRLNEGEQAIITVFGKPQDKALLSPGLQFRMPWWNVHRFEKRILRWDGDASTQLNTAEQTFIHLDTTARWRISNPLQFYTSVKTIRQAWLRLDDILDSVMRTKVSNNNLIELVRNSNREPVQPLLTAFGEDTADEGISSDDKWALIETGRGKIMDQVIAEAKPILAEKMGIELIDVRIKKVNYIERVESSIFDRMIAERKRIAQRYRSEGEGQAAQIIGSMQRELDQITSDAYRLAQEVEGSADAQATAIYANAFNRDPEFYAFLETLKSYEKTLGNKTRFITTTKGDYFKYLKKGSK